jgi:hypothetical protein
MVKRLQVSTLRTLLLFLSFESQRCIEKDDTHCNIAMQKKSHSFMLPPWRMSIPPSELLAKLFETPAGEIYLPPNVVDS